MTKKQIAYVSRPWESTGICSGCKLCELYCSLQHTKAFNPRRSRIRVVEVSTGIDIPVTCQQCEDPACMLACPTGAIFRDSQGGTVLIDEATCNGCAACVGACPYGVVWIDSSSGCAIKCDLCGGAEAACVSICPSRVLIAADAEKVSEANQRRFAALLAMDDELGRPVPAGEDPFVKKQEVRG